MFLVIAGFHPRVEIKFHSMKLGRFSQIQHFDTIVIAMINMYTLSHSASYIHLVEFPV